MHARGFNSVRVPCSPKQHLLAVECRLLPHAAGIWPLRTGDGCHMSNGFCYDLPLIPPDEIQALHCKLAVGVPSKSVVESWQSSKPIYPLWLLLGDQQAINSVRWQNTYKAKAELQTMSIGRTTHGQAGVEQSSQCKTNPRKVKP